MPSRSAASQPAAAAESSLAVARVNPAASTSASSSGGGVVGPPAAGPPAPAGGRPGKIPAFLQKLYTMVDSPETNTLIYWSDGGDSFFVPNHEAFGKELLPRFFKHSNFSSFVRQLNMYGFHKVPHMQQGVLEPNSASELWEFTNPNFRRGEQQLLPLVTRKKAMHPTIEHPDGEVDGGAGGSGSGGGSKVDVPGILNSIAAIRAQQTALTADLKDLQQSNQHLWTEALAARERHKQHQDTTDRILRFLAGVFGQGAAGDIASGVGGDGGNHSVSSAVRAAKETMLSRAGAAGAGAGGHQHHSSSSGGGGVARNRGLMIQGGGGQGTNGLQSMLSHDEPLEEISADRFMEVSPTPTTTGAPTPSDPTSTALVPRTPHGATDINQYFNFNGGPQAGPSSSSSSAAAAAPAAPAPAPAPPLSLEAFTPSFLADFASAVGPLSPATLSSLEPSSTHALDRSYQSADAISTEVDTLQASIEDLVASLGLSGELRPDGGGWDPPNPTTVSDVAAQYTGADDFDMESFLSDLTGSAPTPATGGGGAATDGGQSSASGVSDLSAGGSPEAALALPEMPPLTVPSPAEVSAKRASKRKSDVAFDGSAGAGAGHDLKSQRLA